MLMLDLYLFPVGEVEHERCGMCFCDREACWVLSQEVLFHSAEHWSPWLLAAIQTKFPAYDRKVLL